TSCKQDCPPGDGILQHILPCCSLPFYGLQKIPQQLIFHFQALILGFVVFHAEFVRFSFPGPSLRFWNNSCCQFSLPAVGSRDEFSYCLIAESQCFPDFPQCHPLFPQFQYFFLMLLNMGIFSWHSKNLL